MRHTSTNASTKHDDEQKSVGNAIFPIFHSIYLLCVICRSFFCIVLFLRHHDFSLLLLIVRTLHKSTQSQFKFIHHSDY